jgi:hypothetical protein
MWSFRLTGQGIHDFRSRRGERDGKLCFISPFYTTILSHRDKYVSLAKTNSLIPHNFGSPTHLLFAITLLALLESVPSEMLRCSIDSCEMDNICHSLYQCSCECNWVRPSCEAFSRQLKKLKITSAGSIDVTANPEIISSVYIICERQV